MEVGKNEIGYLEAPHPLWRRRLVDGKTMTSTVVLTPPPNLYLATGSLLSSFKSTRALRTRNLADTPPFGAVSTIPASCRQPYSHWEIHLRPQDEVLPPKVTYYVPLAASRTSRRSLTRLSEHLGMASPSTLKT